MEVLISEVQKRNALWNKKSPRYKDRSYIDNEWEAVAESTGYSKEDAKKKWRNLRDQFIKELKKIPKGKSGDSQDFSAYTGKWQYFTNILFLKDTLPPRDTEGNTSSIEGLEDKPIPGIECQLSEAQEWEENDSVGWNPNVDISEESSIETATLSASQHTDNPLSRFMTTPHRKRKKISKYNKEVEQGLADVDVQKHFLLQTLEDENSLFLRSLLPFFKRLNPVQQLRVRTKFQEILLEEISKDQ